MRLLFVLIFFVFTSSSVAQNIDSLLDEILFEDESLFELMDTKKKNYHFLYLNSGYTGQSTFAGRDLGLDQFNITNQALYFNSKGFNARIYGIWYSELEPNYNVTGVSLGYSYRPKNNKKWRFRSSFDHYFFAQVDGEESSNLTNNISLGLSYKFNKNLSSSFGSSYLLGNEVAPQLSWNIYGRFDLYRKSIFNSITFDPSISFYWSSERVIYQYEQFSPRFPNRTFITEEEQSSFGLMNTRITLPISFNRNKWDFELGYNFVLPTSPLGEDVIGSLNNLSYLSISVGYLIDL
ncbi:MAG: hypothetical protein ACJA2S_004301 [Cyclobacteriaceae bacterium]|jgi:hypothetical protein